jgi:hypothetical protein
MAGCRARRRAHDPGTVGSWARWYDGHVDGQRDGTGKGLLTHRLDPMDPADRLNPGAGLPTLRQKVREALESNLLPAAHAGSVVRRGTGQQCFICHQTITASELECVVRTLVGRDDRSVTVHEPCRLVWRVESMAQARRELELKRDNSLG